MLSHANFLNLVQTGNEAEMPDWNRWSTDDVSLVAMPIFHIGGSGWGVMGLYHGARGVIAREFDPTKVLDFIEQSGSQSCSWCRPRCSSWCGIPAPGRSISRG